MSVGKIEFLARALCEMNDQDPEGFNEDPDVPNWVAYERPAQWLAKLLAKSDKIWNERSKSRVSKKAKKGD